MCIESKVHRYAECLVTEHPTGYMSPEILMGLDFGLETDIFSLGAFAAWAGKLTQISLIN